MCGRLPPAGIAMCQSVVFMNHREIGAVHRINSGPKDAGWKSEIFLNLGARKQFYSVKP